MPELTDWFPADVKPVHVGYYNASVFRLPDTIAWWDGKDWCYPANHDAAMVAQDRDWRGLTKPSQKGSGK